MAARLTRREPDTEEVPHRTGPANRIAIATGSARGIGLSLARLPAKRGARVALTDTTAGLADPQRQRIIDAIPLGRAGCPIDIATVVGFLASDDAGFVTGATLEVDGGLMRR